MTRTAPRRRLTHANLVHVSIAHIDTLNDIATGRGTFASLRDWASNVLTWYRAAQLMGLVMDDMAAQRDACLRLAERYHRTGRVAFDGAAYQLAKHGVDLMDEMARQVPRAIALEAVAWSNAMLAEIYGPEFQDTPAEATT